MILIFHIAKSISQKGLVLFVYGNERSDDVLGE